MNVSAQAQMLWDEYNNGDEDVAYLMEWNLEQDDNRNSKQQQEEDDYEL